MLKVSNGHLVGHGLVQLGLELGLGYGITSTPLLKPPLLKTPLLNTPLLIAYPSSLLL